MPSIVLRGLCGVGVFDGDMMAAMPQGMGHIATLVVATADCDLDSMAQVNPDFISYSNGRQILGWTLSQSRAAFDDGVGAADWLVASERARTLDLGAKHPNAGKTLGKTVPAIKLPDGQLLAGRDSDIYVLPANGTTVPQTAIVQAATSIWWQGSARLLRVKNDVIALMPSAIVEVTNERAVRGGHKHFVMYYDTFFEPPIPANQQVTIESPVPTPHTIDVYDCVPPVPLP